MIDEVFKISVADKKVFVQVLEQFFTIYKKLSIEEAEKRAEEAYNNLVRGLTLSGDLWAGEEKTFAERLNISTEGFYVPSELMKVKYKQPKKKSKKSGPVPTQELEQQQAIKMKLNLFKEYPTLNRRDLLETVDNYCLLSVKIKNLLNTQAEENHTMIKNLVEAQLKIGQYLGINESKKQELKESENRASVASLSQQFQSTIEEFPELMTRFKYEEIRVLLHKYERGELTRALFQLPSYAGMTIEEAYEFVKRYKDKYE